MNRWWTNRHDLQYSSMPVAAREPRFTWCNHCRVLSSNGTRCILLADSTSRWAQAMREMSGRLEEILWRSFPAYFHHVSPLSTSAQASFNSEVEKLALLQSWKRFTSRGNLKNLLPKLLLQLLALSMAFSRSLRCETLSSCRSIDFLDEVSAAGQHRFKIQSQRLVS